VDRDALTLPLTLGGPGADILSSLFKKLFIPRNLRHSYSGGILVIGVAVAHIIECLLNNFVGITLRFIPKTDLRNVL
jgi:hypothetical protein